MGISFSLRYIVLYLAFLVGFVGFFFVAPVVALGLAFYTIFVCLLALFHIVVGEWLDQARGIWYVP